MSSMIVTFPGGKRVDAEYHGFTIRTDQPPKGGGEGSAPQPFDLFLASIATCAGIYVKGYCDTRQIPTENLGIEMHVERDPRSTGSPGSSWRSGCRRGSPRSTGRASSGPRTSARSRSTSSSRRPSRFARNSRRARHRQERAT